MKPKLYSYLAFVLFAAIFIIACKKGDTGPAGPAGPAGAAGATGATGPKGDSATANVTYSAWTDVTFAPDTLHDLPDPTAIDTISFSASIAAPKLTSAVLSQGEIKVYINVGTAANPVVYPLPYSDIIYQSLITITPIFIPNNIILSSNYPNNYVGTYTDTDGKHQQYRYILIPGTKPASATPGLNWSDYNSVKKAFNLPN